MARLCCSDEILLHESSYYTITLEALYVWHLVVASCVQLLFCFCSNDLLRELVHFVLQM